MTGIVSVSATPDDVRRFLDGNRRKYEQDLQRLQLVLSDLRRKERALRHVYKIYSRGEAQAGDELKSARKIRLKFNDFNEKRGAAQASLFDVPDIVGLRIVVPYPSDISAIAAVLDNAIDRKELLAVAMGAAASSSVITTRYGRPLETGGYFACHYNVRLPGVGGARPICEIQIKTLLHDAWGAKTHDLTYKPAGRIGAELLTSFDLLGASLANLDQQSDALKTSIVRNARVREAKRRRVQTCVLHDLSAGALDSVADPALRGELVDLHLRIAGMDADTADEDAQPVANRLIQTFAGQEVASSSLLCFLAAMLQRAIYIEHAQESISAREQLCTDPLDRLGIRFEGSLAAFAAGDVGEAIDMAENASDLMKELQADRGAVSNIMRLDRIAVEMNSNLAYFHADIIGSHDGDRRNAVACGRRYMERSIELYPSIGFPALGIHAADADIRGLLTASPIAAEAFFALDSEAYVAIQTSESEEQLRSARARLGFIHSHAPAQVKRIAGLALDYHDYSARTRLAELESSSTRTD